MTQQTIWPATGERSGPERGGSERGGSERGAIEAVLFDLGGVLLHFGDSRVAPGELDALGLAALCSDLRNGGHRVDDERLIPPLLRRVERYWRGDFLHRLGLDLRQEVARRLVELGQSVPLPAQESAWRAFQRAVSAHIQLDPEAEGMLRRLQRRGYRLGWLSNTVWPLAVLRGDLDSKGVLDYFSVQVCSSEYGSAKPDSAIFEHAAAALGSAPERIAYVGDRPFEDIAGASQLGLVTVLRRPESHAAQDPPPDHRLESLAELPRRLPALAAGGRRVSLEITCHRPKPEPRPPIDARSWPDALLPWIDAARRDPRVHAMAAGGSHGSGTADDYSDLDLLVVTADEHLDAVDGGLPGWLEAFGEILVHAERRDVQAVAHAVHRCVYRDGRRCDVLLTCEGRLGAHPFFRYARVLVDKTGRLSENVRRHETMTFGYSWGPLLERTVSRFCFDAWNACSAVARGRTLEAQAALEQVRHGLFVIAHLAMPAPSFWPDEPYKGLRAVAAHHGLAPAETLAALDRRQQERALIRCVTLFLELAGRWPDARPGPDAKARQAMDALLSELRGISSPAAEEQAG